MKLIAEVSPDEYEQLAQGRVGVIRARVTVIVVRQAGSFFEEEMPVGLIETLSGNAAATLGIKEGAGTLLVVHLTPTTEGAPHGDST